ncbi:MAG: RNA degradosome polyphosphate kinase, partial [Paludibacter sp.]
RDISWMYFNKRILDEAANQSNPLLERIKFLGIYSSNLDEFFRVRVATLRRMIDIEDSVKNVKSDSKLILKKVLKLNIEYAQELEIIFSGIVEELKTNNICLISEKDLDESQMRFLDDFYHDELMNSLFPVLVSQMDEEPVLNDKSTYLAIEISDSKKDDKKRKKKEYALIHIPTSQLSRFLVLPSDNEKQYVIFMDDVIRHCLPNIFASLHYTSYEAYTMKFTRDAELDFDNSAYEGILEKVSKVVKNRKLGAPVRFVYDREMPSGLLRYCEKLLKIDKNAAHISSGRYHNFKDLLNFPNLKRFDLRDVAQPPLNIPHFDQAVNLLDLVRKKDRYLHYPYHSFDYFIRVLREAAINPDVKAIKVTIYRLAKNSKVIQALICAAMNGKKVTANVELFARFDESSNINWAQKMKDAGINVVLGVEGLKVHSKLALISSRRNSVVCIGTGNFHEGTATLYTDFTIMTANKDIVNEVNSLFDFIEHPYMTPSFKHLIVSPNHTRKKIIALINKEIENAGKGLPAYLWFKVNHIVDDKIIEKLYEASNAGVEIKLLVRGNCSLITGVAGMSKNIEVYGIIDRYLEHSRILIFGNGGDEKYYIGSADLMERNLDRRIEVFTPVYDIDIQKQLRLTIEYGLRDNVKARIVDGMGSSELHKTNDDVEFRSQEELYKFYKSAIN